MSRIQVQLGEAEPVLPHGGGLNLVSSLVMVGSPGIEIHLIADCRSRASSALGLPSCPKNT